MERSEIAIIIPAYNEASTIDIILKKVIKYGTIILINDGSTDNTLELAKKHDIIIINNEQNFGYDKSLNIGFNYSKINSSTLLLSMQTVNTLQKIYP